MNMMFLYKAFLIALLLVIAPAVLGSLLTDFKRKGDGSLTALYVKGWLVMMAVFQLFAIPLIFTRADFTTLVHAWTVVIVLLSVILLVRNRKEYYKIWKQYRYGRRETVWPYIFAIELIIVLTMAIVLLQHVDDDDAFYVGTAVTTLQTDSMYEYDAYTGDVYGAFPARYVLSPFPVFVALIAKLTMLHPTIIAHTVLPVFLIPLAFMVYGLIGRELFGENKKAVGFFLLALLALNLWGNFSVYTSSSFLLFRIWQGKAVLASILLPLVIYSAGSLLNEKGRGQDWLMTLALALSGCMVSSMGIFLMPMSLGVYALVYLATRRKAYVIGRVLSCCTPCIIYGLIYIFAL